VLGFYFAKNTQGATSIAQESAEIAQMSNDVIKLSESAKESSDVLIKTVSSFKI
jgi:methyl-accepting chemotaxis protein